MYINRKIPNICILEEGVPEEIEREIFASEEEESDLGRAVEMEVIDTVSDRSGGLKLEL